VCLTVAAVFCVVIVILNTESAELRYFEVPFDPDTDEVAPDLPVTSLRGVVCVAGSVVSLVPHTSDGKDWICVKCAADSGTPGRELVLATFVASDGKALLRALTGIAAKESLSTLHLAWKVSFPLIFGAGLADDPSSSGGKTAGSPQAVSGDRPQAVQRRGSSKAVGNGTTSSSSWGSHGVKDLADVSASVPAAGALALAIRRLVTLTQVRAESQWLFPVNRIHAFFHVMSCPGRNVVQALPIPAGYPVIANGQLVVSVLSPSERGPR
jgi:hypothetical protein